MYTGGLMAELESLVVSVTEGNRCERIADGNEVRCASKGLVMTDCCGFLCPACAAGSCSVMGDRHLRTAEWDGPAVP